MLGFNSKLTKKYDIFANNPSRFKSQISQILPLDEGSLPIIYLGVPLISSILLHKDCKVLDDKVKNKLKDWKIVVIYWEGSIDYFCSFSYAYLLILNHFVTSINY